MPQREDERRTHPRFPRSFELSGAPAAGGTSARLIATNLSLGGVYCTSDRDFPEMTRLAVQLLLPSRGSKTEALNLSAVVVRHKELSSASNGDRYELALLFTSLTSSQRELLAHLLTTS